jgi:hypothetical protein
VKLVELGSDHRIRTRGNHLPIFLLPGHEEKLIPLTTHDDDMGPRTMPVRGDISPFGSFHDMDADGNIGHGEAHDRGPVASLRIRIQGDLPDVRHVIGFREPERPVLPFVGKVVLHVIRISVFKSERVVKDEFEIVVEIDHMRHIGRKEKPARLIA